MSAKVFSILYHSIVNLLGGDKNAAILLDRSLYWSKTKKGERFYKHNAPCDSFRDGDSWQEELNFSRRDLDGAAKKITNPHKTKGAFDKASDKFEGKLYATYHDRRSNRKYYVLNKVGLVEFLARGLERETLSKYVKGIMPQHLLEDLLDSLYTPLDSEVDAVLECTKTVPERSVEIVQNVQSNNVLLRNTLQNITTLTRDPSEAPVDNSREEEVKLRVKKMINTWNSHMNDDVRLWPSHVSRLSNVLQSYFGDSLERWEVYCKRIASHPFYSGKSSPTYKTYLWEAVKPEFLDANIGESYRSDEKDLDSKIKHLSNQLEISKSKEKSHLDNQAIARKEKILKKCNELPVDVLAKEKAEFDKTLEDSEANKPPLTDLESRLLFQSHLEIKIGREVDREPKTPDETLDKIRDEMKCIRGEIEIEKAKKMKVSHRNPEKSIIEIRNRHVSKSSYASPSDLPKRTVAIVASPIQKIIESDEPEAIKNVRKKLVETLSPEVYKSWFSKVAMRISGDFLVLNVPTKFDGDWIAEKYEGNIKSIAESLGLRFLIELPQRSFVESKTEAAREKPKQGIASSLFRVPAFTDVPKYLDPNSGDILAKKAQWARMAG